MTSRRGKWVSGYLCCPLACQGTGLRLLSVSQLHDTYFDVQLRNLVPSHLLLSLNFPSSPASLSPDTHSHESLMIFVVHALSVFLS